MGFCLFMDAHSQSLLHVYQLLDTLSNTTETVKVASTDKQSGGCKAKST